MEKNIENLDSPNQEVTEPENQEVGLPAEQPEVEPKDDEVEDTEALKQKNQALYEQLRKAKGFIRDAKTGEWVKKEEVPRSAEPVVSIADIHALRNVHDDDIAEVQEYAEFKGISIKEALKTSVVKTLLAEHEEFRKIASAANTGSSKRGTSNITDEALLASATKGALPTDDEGIARLAKLDAGKPKG